MKNQLLEEMEQCGFARMDVIRQHRWIAEFVMRQYAGRIEESICRAGREKTAYYFSAEFLLGRLIHSNLYNLGILDEVCAAMREAGSDPDRWEEIPDHALGNGGLGRLAACFLDAAAAQDIPLWGYGIRYRWGFFSQKLRDGGQTEEPDDWMRAGDPWSLRRDEDTVIVSLGRSRVRAVPYDLPVFGYTKPGGSPRILVLRLWQAEGETPLDLQHFNEGRYTAASAVREQAERLSAVLYPGDATSAGKQLRLSQQIFFSDASVEDILRRFEKHCGQDWARLPERAAIQLNDTHPVWAIPALISRLEGRGVPWTVTIELAGRIFSYTNHTVMAEALEVWDEALVQRVAPHFRRILQRLNVLLEKELREKNTDPAGMRILENGRVHMARLASFVCRRINGVAPLHTEILRKDVLRAWESAYPGRIRNVTNGITQRRWLGIANSALASFVSERVGDGWQTDLSRLSALKPYAADAISRREFMRIRKENKRSLSQLIGKLCGTAPDPEMLFDIQIKRLHEYKRQLMNAFSVWRLYRDVLSGAAPDLTPTAFLFAGKSAPGYARAKGIIRYILAMAERINHDPAVRGRIGVYFLPDYSVSLAEKLVAAGDLSEQISRAGTEASGTGNMKCMLNGMPTLGSRDGANLEILCTAGEENNFFFGPDAEGMRERMRSYEPRRLMETDPRLAEVVNTLIDGTFDDGGSGIFAELYTSLLEGASWHQPDHYCVLGDFTAYMEAKSRALNAYRDPDGWAARGLLNMASAGWVSADRAVCEYARDIWQL